MHILRAVSGPVPAPIELQIVCSIDFNGSRTKTLERTGCGISQGTSFARRRSKVYSSYGEENKGLMSQSEKQVKMFIGL